jgi:hypothetical protein
MNHSTSKEHLKIRGLGWAMKFHSFCDIRDATENTHSGALPLFPRAEVGSSGGGRGLSTPGVVFSRGGGGLPGIGVARSRQGSSLSMLGA